MADETQLATRDPRPLQEAGFTFTPQTWEQLYSYAKEIASTDFVPRSMQGKPGAVLAAWQTGKELGLPPMASLQSIAIINGRPSVHSNGFWALTTSHPLCEWFKETPPDEALKQGFGECSIKRRGNPHVITRRFTMEEAKTAGLLGKDNWKNYPGDMLQNRARHRASDDAIPEACQGVLPSDIARDLEPVDVTPPREQISAPQPLHKEPENGKDRSAAGSTVAPEVGEGGNSRSEDNGQLSQADGEKAPEGNSEPKPEEKPEKVAKGKKAKEEPKVEEKPVEAGEDPVEIPDWLAEGTEKEKTLYHWLTTCPLEELGEQVNKFTMSFNSIGQGLAQDLMRDRQLRFLRAYNDRRQGKA